MEIIVNYWAVLGASIFLMVMGAVWYGPLFGKHWMKIIGAEHMSKDEMEKTQKEMMPMYVLQFVLTLITSFVLYYFIKLIPVRTGIDVAFWIWVGFAMPAAAGSIWDTKKGLRLQKFLIVAGYQLVTLLVLGWMFGMY
jgi:hypothetical protein